MAPNYDGLFELNVLYDVTISSRALPHRQAFDVKCLSDPAAGAEPEDIDLTQRSGVIMTLREFVEDYATYFASVMGTETSQPSFELWRYDAEPSLSKTFISAFSLLAPIVYSGSGVAAHSRIYTFRTLLGDTARLYFMEDKNSLETRVTSGAMTGADLALKNFFTSVNSPVVGRDNNYLIGGIAVNFGQNEKIRNLRFRTF